MEYQILDDGSYFTYVNFPLSFILILPVILTYALYLNAKIMRPIREEIKSRKVNEKKKDNV